MRPPHDVLARPFLLKAAAIFSLVDEEAFFFYFHILYLAMYTLYNTHM